MASELAMMAEQVLEQMKPRLISMITHIIHKTPVSRSIVESELVGMVLLRFLAGKEKWRGSASELYSALSRFSGDPEYSVKWNVGWPCNQSLLSKCIRRLVNHLNINGWSIYYDKSSKDNGRTISFQKSKPAGNTTSRAIDNAFWVPLLLFLYGKGEYNSNLTEMARDMYQSGKLPRKLASVDRMAKFGRWLIGKDVISELAKAGWTVKINYDGKRRRVAYFTSTEPDEYAQGKLVILIDPPNRTTTPVTWAKAVELIGNSEIYDPPGDKHLFAIDYAEGGDEIVALISDHKYPHGVWAVIEYNKLADDEKILDSFPLLPSPLSP